MKEKDHNRKNKYRNMSMKELKEAAKTLMPILRLGKNGITEGVIDEIDIHLKKRSMIKIKLLGSFRENYDRRTISEEIASRTKSKVVLQVGGSLVLYRR